MDASQEIRNILIQLEIFPKDICVDDDYDLLSEYFVDSYKFVEFIVLLEELFKIEMDEEDILVEKFESIHTISDMINSKCLEK